MLLGSESAESDFVIRGLLMAKFGNDKEANFAVAILPATMLNQSTGCMGVASEG